MGFGDKANAHVWENKWLYNTFPKSVWTPFSQCCTTEWIVDLFMSGMAM